MPTQRYRVLNCICTNKNTTYPEREFLSQSETTFQCDTLNEVLSQLKDIIENYPECTKFTIERGEWL